MTAGTPPTGTTVGAERYAHKWIIALGVTLAAVLELIDTSIINVALAQMSSNLGATLDEVAWVSTGYIVAAVIVLPMTGWLSAQFGRKRYFTASILVFTAASMLCGLSSSLTELVVWRVVQGLGGGALVATSQAILFESFPPEEQTLAAAIFGIGMMVGPAIGPTLGGVIVDRYSWPWIFYINLPVGLLAAALTWGYVTDAHGETKADRVDLAGFVLIAVGIGCLQFVLERGDHYDWFDEPLIVALSIVSFVAIAALVWWELRAPEPVLDLRVLKDRSLAAGSLFAVALGVALYGSIFALPIYIQQLLSYDAETAGWALFPGALGSAVALAAIARNARRIPDLRVLIAIGAVCVVVSMWWHAQFTTATSQAQMLWPVVLRGFGTGCMFVPLSTTALSQLRGKALSQGSAIFNLMRQLGGSVGIAVLATMLTQRTHVHRARLIEHLSVGDLLTQQRLTAVTRGLVARGVDSVVASRRAYGLLDLTVQRQSTMLAFNDVFLIVGVVMLCSLPLILLLRRPTGELHMGE